MPARDMFAGLLLLSANETSISTRVSVLQVRLSLRSKAQRLGYNRQCFRKFMCRHDAARKVS